MLEPTEHPAPAVRVSVVIPVHNAAEWLVQCLDALRLSMCTPLECIVVDDGSIDLSAEVARKAGVCVLNTGARLGPAAARNRGAAHATGEILLFLDADVCVQAGTLERIAAAFAADPSLDALMGSYDDAPASPTLCSQYRNLLHCFVHQRGRRQAFTFWAGCGAVRRNAFAMLGGFDECHTSASIEDIEFGYRLVRGGGKVILNPAVQVKHLKRWTLFHMLKTDIVNRGVPWTRLILRSGKMPDDLNLRWSQRVSVLAAWGTAGLLAIAVARRLFGDGEISGSAAIGATICLAVLLALNLPFYRFLTGRRGALFTLAVIPLHFCHHFLNGVSFLAGMALHVTEVARDPAGAANPRRMDLSS